jgi:hypothetical protein
MLTVTPARFGQAVPRYGATRAGMLALYAVNALLLTIAVLVLLRLGPAPDAPHGPPGPQPAPAPAPAPVAPR